MVQVRMKTTLRTITVKSLKIQKRRLRFKGLHQGKVNTLKARKAETVMKRAVMTTMEMTMTTMIKMKRRKMTTVGWMILRKRGGKERKKE